MIIVYILFFILFVTLILSVFLLKSLLFNRLKTDEHLDNYYLNSFGENWNNKISNWYNNVNKEYFNIESKFDYKLNCYEIKNNLDKYVIILHGVTTNKEFARKFAYLYDTLGYSIIALDSRYHGKSGGKNITYGYYEKYDIETVVKWIRENRGDVKIGIHGESMGAGILLSYASMVKDDLNFYIADCPYSSFELQVINTIKKMLKTPMVYNNILFYVTNLLAKLIYKVDLYSIDIINHISKVKSPILFLNAKNDDYIQPDMTTNLYEACEGNNKEIHWFDNGYHAGAYNYQPDEYINVVKNFLKEHVEQ